MTILSRDNVVVVMFSIVETDNFDGDYPDEKFLSPLPLIREEELAQKIADAINSCIGEESKRFWKVVRLPYTLRHGFEP